MSLVAMALKDWTRCRMEGNKNHQEYTAGIHMYMRYMLVTYQPHICYSMKLWRFMEIQFSDSLQSWCFNSGLEKRYLNRFYQNWCKLGSYSKCSPKKLIYTTLGKGKTHLHKCLGRGAMRLCVRSQEGRFNAQWPSLQQGDAIITSATSAPSGSKWVACKKTAGSCYTYTLKIMTIVKP